MFTSGIPGLAQSLPVTVPDIPISPSQVTDHISGPSSTSYLLNVNKCTVGVKTDVRVAIAAAINMVSAQSPILLGRHLSPDESARLDTDEITAFFALCEEEFVRGNAEERARSDAEDFVFPASDLLRDGDSLRRLHTIEAVVQERHSLQSAGRFNSDRYAAHLSSTSDAHVLCGLAGVGAPIPVAHDFVFNPIAEAPRKLQLKLGNCYCKHAYKLWKSGGALIFREEDIPVDERSKLNINPLHWCPKPFCKCGRWLGDLSNRLLGTSINCPESKELARDLFGDMGYPSIEEIIIKWLDYADKNNYHLYDLRIWKEDIRSAFSQFNIQPSDTYKLAFTFAEGLILVMIWGFFGWTGAPMVFANFSRAILEVLLQFVLGCLFIFCDDFIGCGHFSIVDYDQTLARDMVVKVFGEGKVALEKSVLPSTEAEVLGWWVDLVAGTIRPSDKGIRKLMFVFFTLDISSTHWSLQMCQVLASLAQRYSQALMGMRPFVHAFHELCSGPPSQWRRVSAKAKFAVEMWRSMLLLLFINKEHMSVSLRVMVGSSIGFDRFELISDGSYLGVGVLEANEQRNWSTSPFMSYLFKFKQNRKVADLPKYQNHREFVGLVVAILFMVRSRKLPPTGAVIVWVNDNTSALEWARTNMCKGRSSQVVFMLYSLILIKYKLHVVQVEHIAGSSLMMKPVDALSRGLPTPELNPSLSVDFSSSTSLDNIMSLCNPTLNHSVEEYHYTFVMLNDLLCQFEGEC